MQNDIFIVIPLVINALFIPAIDIKEIRSEDEYVWGLGWFP